jgi:hypothetical protein
MILPFHGNSESKTIVEQKIQPKKINKNITTAFGELLLGRSSFGSWNFN